jgi:hypothetical protein
LTAVITIPLQQIRRRSISFFLWLTGNYWVYDAKAYNSDGSVAAKITQTVEVTGTETFQGHPSFDVDVGSGPTGGQLYFYSGSDLYAGFTGGINPNSQIMLRYPMSPGETFVISDTTYYASYRYREELIFRGNNQSVTVPAGTFSCYRFEHLSMSGNATKLDTQQIDEQFFSPGVGLIEINTYGKDTLAMKLGVSEQLTSYRVE